MRQRLRQLAAGGGDRGLHVLRGGIDVAVEVELQRDRGRPERAGRGHLRDAGDLGELALERRRDRGGHGVRAGAGKLGRHLMVGKSTCGSGATGSSGKATSPTKASAAISSDVAIGRRMKGSEMFMARLPALAAVAPWRRHACRAAAGTAR